MRRNKECEIPEKRRKEDDKPAKCFAEVFNHQRERVTSNINSNSSAINGTNPAKLHSGKWSESAEKRMAMLHAIASGQTNFFSGKVDEESAPKPKQPRRNKAAMLFSQNHVEVPPCKTVAKPITIDDPPSDSEFVFSRTKDRFSSRPKPERPECKRPNVNDIKRTAIKSHRSSRTEFLKSLHDLAVDCSSEEETPSTRSLSVEDRCIKGTVKIKKGPQIIERVCRPVPVKCMEELAISKRVYVPEVVLCSDKDANTHVSNVFSTVYVPEVVLCSDEDANTHVSNVFSTVCVPEVALSSKEDVKSCDEDANIYDEDANSWDEEANTQVSSVIPVCSPEVVAISSDDDCVSSQVSNVSSTVCVPEVVVLSVADDDVNAKVSNVIPVRNPEVVAINSDHDYVSAQVSDVTSTVRGSSDEVLVILSDDSQSSFTEESTSFSQLADNKSKCNKVRHRKNVDEQPHTSKSVIGANEDSIMPSCDHIPLVMDRIVRSCLSSEITTEVEGGLEMLYTLISPESKLTDKLATKVLHMLLETTNEMVARTCYDIVVKQYAFHSWDVRVDLWKFIELSVKSCTHVDSDPTHQSSSKQLCSFLVTVLEESWSRTTEGSNSFSLAKKTLDVSGQFYKVKEVVNGITEMCNQNKLQDSDCGHHLFRLLKLIALVNDSLHVGRRIAEEVYPIVKRTSTSRLRESIINMIEPHYVKMCLLTLIVTKDENTCKTFGFHKRKLSMEFRCDNLVDLFLYLGPLKSLQCDLSDGSSGNTEEQSYNELIFVLSSMLQTFVEIAFVDAVKRPPININGLQNIYNGVDLFCERMMVVCPSLSNSPHLEDMRFLAESCKVADV